MSNFQSRLVGAALLDAKIYEEVERDPHAMSQALGVIALSAVASSVGAAGVFGVRALIGGVLAAILGWGVWAGIIYIVGTRAMPDPQTKADFPEVMRTLGFAAAPGIANVLGVVPLLGWLVRLVVLVWQIAAMVVAVRQVLDYRSTGKAVAVVILGVIAYLFVSMILGTMGILSGIGVSALF